MITVKYDRKGLSLEMQGHAGTAPKGEDLVCAAASILGFTLVERVTEERDKYFPQIAQIDGMLRVSCRPESKWHTKMCRRDFDTIFVGLELLASKYPDNVLTIKGE